MKLMQKKYSFIFTTKCCYIILHSITCLLSSIVREVLVENSPWLYIQILSSFDYPSLPPKLFSRVNLTTILPNLFPTPPFFPFPSIKLLSWSIKVLRYYTKCRDRFKIVSVEITTCISYSYFILSLKSITIKYFFMFPFLKYIPLFLLS